MTGLGEGKAGALSTNYTSPEDVSLSTRTFFKKKNPKLSAVRRKAQLRTARCCPEGIYGTERKKKQQLTRNPPDKQPKY